MSGKLKNAMIKGALIVALVSTCGISTVRGVVGMNRSISTYRGMAGQISSANLPSECLISKSKISKALEPILGTSASEKVAESLVPHVNDYRKEVSKAITKSEKDEASTVLAARIYSSIQREVRAQETPSQKRDWGWTFSTMIAFSEASQSGADGAVYGPTVKRCVEAITQMCKS